MYVAKVFVQMSLHVVPPCQPIPVSIKYPQYLMYVLFIRDKPRNVRTYLVGKFDCCQGIVLMFIMLLFIVIFQPKQN